jgi:hypothetical protein
MLAQRSQRHVGQFFCEGAATQRRIWFNGASKIVLAVANWIKSRDGTRLHWTQWGVGRPILFLNSAGVGTQMWDYQMMAFAGQGYRCIAFDRRGHGLSETSVSGYDFDTFADDIHSVIKALDLANRPIIPTVFRVPFSKPYTRRGARISRNGSPTIRRSSSVLTRLQQ